MPPRSMPKESTPRRNTTSDGGCIRFDRDLRRVGVGRIQISSGTTDPKEFLRRNSIITQLVRDCQIETLQAFQDRELSIEELVDADKHDRLHRVLQDSRRRRGIVPITDDGEGVVHPTAKQRDGVSEAQPTMASQRASSIQQAPTTSVVPTDVANIVASLFALLQSSGVALVAGAQAGVLAAAENAVGDANRMAAIESPLWPGQEAPYLGLSLDEPADARLFARLSAAPLWKTLINRVPLLDSGPDTKRRYIT
jgi:hypothetical protein